MLTYIHGNDRGYAVLKAVITILILSIIAMSVIHRVETMKYYSIGKKNTAIWQNEQDNAEAENYYDLH